MSDKFKNTIIKAAVFIASVSVLVLLDQWTKGLAVKALKDSTSFVILENILELRYLENTGAAFGLMKGMRILFLVTTPLICLLLFFLSLRLFDRQKMRPLCYCFLFITAGAIGNYIDRLCNAYVVDFIYFSLIDFPVFNVADIYVTCASIVLMLLLLFKYKEEDFERRNSI